MYLEHMTLYNMIFDNKCKSVREFQLDFIPRGVEGPVRSVYTDIILYLYLSLRYFSTTMQHDSRQAELRRHVYNYSHQSLYLQF